MVSYVYISSISYDQTQFKNGCLYYELAGSASILRGWLATNSEVRLSYIHTQQLYLPEIHDVFYT
jgi:hypothetical protein